GGVRNAWVMGRRPSWMSATSNAAPNPSHAPTAAAAGRKSPVVMTTPFPRVRCRSAAPHERTKDRRRREQQRRRNRVHPPFDPAEPLFVIVEHLVQPGLQAGDGTQHLTDRRFRLPASNHHANFPTAIQWIVKL